MRYLIVALLLAAATPALAQQQVDPRVQAMQQAVATRMGTLEMENTQLRVLLENAQQDAKAARDELAKTRAARPPASK